MIIQCRNEYRFNKYGMLLIRKAGNIYFGNRYDPVKWWPLNWVGALIGLILIITAKD